jgi:demethylmenaquinone methyltransferase/2-methoxy-6-polyprenyl-1,4-benzoquinol methylase
MSSGARPQGATGEQQAARWVRDMFSRIAPRYDLLNHLLSFQLDRVWRARAVRRLRRRLADAGVRILDICCGSGDLTLALAAAAHPAALVVGSDFARPMLTEASRKIERRGAKVTLLEADALLLPFKDGAFDVLTVAFGFRNLASYESGLREMLRVLRPGGVAALLEFSQPPNRLFARAYSLYANRILPAVGGWISGSPDAYAYLPASVNRFPEAPELAEMMRRVGFLEVRFERMSAGIVALHSGIKPA